MNVYFISGLGADKSVFQKIHLPGAYRVHHIEWIAPVAGETMRQYATRLAACIDRSQPFALVGLSFGGMIATEMNQFLNPVATIIISSASCRKQLPWYFRLAGWLHMEKLVPVRFYKTPNRFFYFLFGIRTSGEKRIFQKILRQSDGDFLVWAIRAVLHWQNKTAPPGVVHIHGTADHLLPVRYVQPNYVVKGGRHLMVYSRADELTKLLVEILQNAVAPE